MLFGTKRTYHYRPYKLRQDDDYECDKKLRSFIMSPSISSTSSSVLYEIEPNTNTLRNLVIPSSLITSNLPPQPLSYTKIPSGLKYRSAASFYLRVLLGLFLTAAIISIVVLFAIRHHHHSRHDDSFHTYSRSTILSFTSKIKINDSFDNGSSSLSSIKSPNIVFTGPVVKQHISDMPLLPNIQDRFRNDLKLNASKERGSDDNLLGNYTFEQLQSTYELPPKERFKNSELINVVSSGLYNSFDYLQRERSKRHMLIIDDNVTEDANANGHHRVSKESSAKADEEDGLVIYRFKLADHVYRIKLITPPVPLTYSSNDDYFSSTAGLPNRRKIMSKIGSSRDQAYKKADSKILIQYFSSKSNSTDGRPIREEEVTLTDRAKCIYEGYVNQRSHDIILFDAPVLSAAAETPLTTPPYDVSNDNNNKLGDSTSATSEFNFATTAVFNLCGKGLMGMFQIGDKQYFIEPLQVKSIRYTASNNYTYDIPYKGDDDKGNGTAKQVSQPHIVYSLSPQKLPFDKYNFTQDSKMFSKPSLPSSPPYFPTAKNDDDGSLNRKVKKRSISREHFIETMVVADFDVAKSHGPDLHRYIMTIISIVEMIYKNPSIGNAINIVLVKIAIFQDSNYAPKITGNGELTLGNFCEWQNRHNTKSLYEPFHHDTAILLTRQDICSNEINCQTLAMTRGSICDPSTSCAIAEDNGLSVALTIAHEIGHNLGVPHDGDPYCKEFEMKEQEDDLKTFHIMSKVLFQNNRILSWSKCSQHYISLFLDKGLGHCLLNKPERMEYMSQMKVLRLPGEEYSLHQQCQLIFGPQSYFCPHVNKFPCQYLYCLNEDRKCMYGDAHWADGTSCGTNKWCQSGSCAERVAHSIISLDGGWSDWSNYTTCSRSCGGGIRISTRACTNPTPANNGKYCLGERSRAESCNTHDCEEGDGDFRDVQCARYNNNNRGIIGIDPNVKWIGTYTIPYQDRCKLYCKEEHRTGIYKLADKVIDGTPCDLESTEICIQGICKRVGCDHVINSLAKLDKCGICGGDNSTCLTQAGFYNQIKFGYNNVARIPAGATNLDVRQYGIHGLEADDNYLALMDSNGEYLINGGNSITMTRLDIKHEGTLLQYTGSNKAVERINSTAIIKRDLILQVLTVGELYPPDVRYTYDISSRYKLKKQIYTWNPQGPWSKCGCDGLKSRTILCVNTISYGVESDQKCQHLPTPRPYEESCLRQCKFKWKISNVTPCSVDCGYGFKKNTVVCVKVDEKSSTNRDRDTIVPDSECKTVPLKPPFVEPCSVKPCSTNTYYWEYSQWSECSALCDGGVRTRQASCKDIFNNNRTLHPQTCNNSLTVLSEMCNSTPCRPKWIISNWTLCNVPCGNGYKSRTIQCQFKNQLVALSKCADILGTKPPIEQEPCEGKKLCRWHADPWNKCHNPSGNAVEKCGGEVVGVQERAVKCLLYDSDANIISPASTMIDERHCISFYANKIKPKLSRRCKISCDEQNDRKMKAQLPYQKNVDDISNNIIHQDTNVAALVPIIPTFSQYQTSLDSKQRSPSLLTNNNNNHQQNHMRLEDGTNNNIIYPNLSPTSKDLLATAWKTGTWSQCTKSCGYGIKIRSVYCSYVNGTFIPDQRTCESLKNKPIHSQSCIQRYCEWNFGEWDQCDPPCAGSYKTRKIFCTPIAQNGHHSVIATLESDCDYRLKPINRTKCSHLLPPCTSSDHSAISSSTIRPITKDEIVLVYPTANDYGGRNLRSDDTAPSQIASAAVAPLNSVGKTFPLSLIKKNDNVFNDILKRQFVWRIGPWSPCSSACGHGWRRRSVLCQNTDGTISTHCSLHDKPPAMEQCLGQMCFAWINVSLSQCIQNDCNIYGYQRQRVYCQRGRDFAIVPDELCPQNIRPKDYGNCISPHCIRVNRNSTTNRLFPPNNPQRPSSTQYDTRRLHSRHKGIHEPINRESKHRGLFSKISAVNNNSSCLKHKCPIWRTSNWSKCSNKCGPGIKIRRVICNIDLKKVNSFYCHDIPKPITLKHCRGGHSGRKTSTDFSGNKRRNCLKDLKNKNFKKPDLLPNNKANDIIQKINLLSKIVDNKLRRLSNKQSLNISNNDMSIILNRENKIKDLRRRDKLYYSEERQKKTRKFNFYKWQTSNWTRCKFHGCDQHGYKFRRVWCSKNLAIPTKLSALLNNPQFSSTRKINFRHCAQLKRPKSMKQCKNNYSKCILESCEDVQQKLKTTKNGNYTLLLDGKKIKIYCHDMETLQPKEYISVLKQDNYAEFYDKRLSNPSECFPSKNCRTRRYAMKHKRLKNLTNRCLKLKYDFVGKTSFFKIRINITTMQIKGDDYAFAQLVKGSYLPYATAGDCYSLSNCPQGRFSIDLKTTGFVLSNLTRWTAHGNKPTQKLSINKGKTRIIGKCGGYCGKCTPYYKSGLILAII